MFLIFWKVRGGRSDIDTGWGRCQNRPFLGGGGGVQIPKSLQPLDEGLRSQSRFNPSIRTAQQPLPTEIPTGHEITGYTRLRPVGRKRIGRSRTNRNWPKSNKCFFFPFFFCSFFLFSSIFFLFSSSSSLPNPEHLNSRLSTFNIASLRQAMLHMKAC